MTVKSTPTRGSRALAGWGVVAGLTLLSAAFSAYEIVPASVTPILRRRLDIGPVAAGWLVSGMLGALVLASVPAGALLDRFDSRLAVAAATAAFLATSLWGWYAATAGSYRWLLAARVVAGLAYAVVWNAGAVLAGRAFEGDRRATAVGTFTASAPLGFAAGQFGGPVVAAALGWAAVFVVFALPATVGAALFWLASARLPGVETAPAVPSRTEVASVLTDGDVWVVCAMGFLCYALYLFLNSWMPTYLTEAFGLPVARSGALVAAFPAIGILGRIGSGAVSDRLFGGRRRPVGLLTFAVVAPAFVGLALVESVPLFVAFLVTAGFFIQLSLGLFFTYVRELVDPAVAGTAISMLSSVGLFGAFVAPVFGGFLLERTGSYATAFAVAAGAAVVGLLLAWYAPRDRD